ncbi:MAG: polynucleotide adenylyltransferase [Clostridia bacterium]|nr:polynucleotide adenylyltransferase [Clostridia bacterium]
MSEVMIKYPENVSKIAKILSDNGYKAYAVGGCIRDALMEKNPADWDMTTDCPPSTMLEIFEKAGLRTIPTGLKHGTVTILIGKESYECTTFRIDGSYTDSRHPDSVTFTPELSEDLRRRDFTVNAMAGDPLLSNGITDIFGGRNDIENKIIRAVGDPEKRFTEDALRILRAVRFATTLDFLIDNDTKAAAKLLGNRLKDVSAERKAVELKKILLSKNADRGISLLLELDLAKYIHPSISLPKTTVSSLPERFATRLASLFHGVPNLSVMKLSNEITTQVKLLCDDDLYDEIINSNEQIDVKARLMLSKYGELAEDAALLRENGKLSTTISAEREKNPCVKIFDLAVSGNDILNIGIKPRNIGNIMQKLLALVIKNPSLNEKGKLLSIVTEINE